MARFVFKLQPLLELRRREERECMRRVAEIERERLEVESEAARLASLLEEERSALRGELEGGRGVNLTRVRLQSSAALHGLRLRRQLALTGAAVAKRLDAARAELGQATARRRAVELLRERRLEAWLAAERSRESREMDELVTSRFGRPRADEEGAAA